MGVDSLICRYDASGFLRVTIVLGTSLSLCIYRYSKASGWNIVYIPLGEPIVVVSSLIGYSVTCVT